MAHIALDEVTAISAGPSFRTPPGTIHHVVDTVFNSKDDTEISAVVVKLQGSETNEDGVDGIITESGLVVGSTAEAVGNIAFTYKIAGVTYSKGAVAAGTAISGFTLTGTAGTFGGFIVQINSAGTVTTKAPTTPMAYATMALANAAVDDVNPDSANVKMGKVLMACDGTSWTAGTDDLTSTDLDANAGFISLGSSFTDLSTHTFTSAELANARAVFNIDAIGTSYARVYLSTITGTGTITSRYSSVSLSTEG